MQMEQVTLKLLTPQLEAAERLARRRDVTIGQVLRDALAAELRRAGDVAKTSARADEQLLAPLRALLAPIVAEATGWTDLQNRLKSKGYAFREAGGGLALHAHPDGARLCKASELGTSYATLMRRFHAPFPGHSHRHLVARHLGRDDPLIDPF